MIKDLGLKSLEHGRKAASLITFYKIVNNIVAIEKDTVAKVKAFRRPCIYSAINNQRLTEV